MKISLRLKTIASFVPKDAYILDCGCDHAYIPIYLILNQSIKKAYASDINEKPLKIAEENILKYNLKEKITLYQADGLDNLNKKVDTIILSGMGTSTIINILKKGDLKNINNLIISSNNDYELLRNEIVKFGYIITNETVILDKSKYYEIILFSKGNTKYTKKELKYGPILIKKRDETYKKYMKFRLEKSIKLYNLLKINHPIKKILIKKEIREIKKLI